MPYFRNYLAENISLLIKFNVKCLCGYMTSSKYFYLEYILLVVHATTIECSTAVKVINTLLLLSIHG